MLLSLASAIYSNDTYITVYGDGGGRVYNRSVYTHYGTNGCNGSCGYDPYRTNYIVGGGGSSEYKLDQWCAERKAEVRQPHVGLITRFGYGFNYDAFMYGFSLLYHWEGLLGITAGFDGYSFNKVMTKDGNVYQTNGLPLWDVRLGFELGRYFVFGGLIGKFTVDVPGEIKMKDDAWFCNDDGTLMYGGFVTFILPVSKYFGFNIDLAVTNKTGFNIGLGINATFPIK